MDNKRLIKFLIGLLPLLLLFVDVPTGMNPKAWGLFPFYAGAILMVILGVRADRERRFFCCDYLLHSIPSWKRIKDRFFDFVFVLHTYRQSAR